MIIKRPGVARPALRGRRWAGAAMAVALLSAGEEKAPACSPEDLGPSAIDVSGYPEEHRKTYREIFQPVFRFLRIEARVANSPIVELDEAREKAERARHPGLFADPRIAVPTRDGWKTFVDGVYRRPRCCGACPVLTLEEARALRRFLVYDSLRRKTGDAAEAWIRHRKGLSDRFEKEREVQKHQPQEGGQ